MALWRKYVTWSNVIPIVGLLTLAVTLVSGAEGAVVLSLVGVVLAASVLAAVHHAEVVARRVGEPYGALILAIAVTVIEVGMILMLMLGGKSGTASLARDTVFAAVMIACNGIVGMSLLFARQPSRMPTFRAESSGAALATVLTLATVTMVLPTFTMTTPGPTFAPAQLGFVAVASLAVWGAFVFTQTGRNRDLFLAEPSLDLADVNNVEAEAALVPSNARAWMSVGLLLAGLVAVVGLAKVATPALEASFRSVGLPHAFVGVVIAMLVLLPESLAAYRTARRGFVQTSLNLAYGSAIASIGLTIPVIAGLSYVLNIVLVLGLDPVHIVLLTLTAIVGVLTVVQGSALRLQGALHLVILASYVFLSAMP